MAFAQWLLRIYVYLACVLIFASFSSITPIASSVLKIFSAPVLFLVFILRWTKKGKNNPYLLLPWLSIFLIWLFLQQAGIWVKMPFFDVPSDWGRWYGIYSLLFTGFVLYMSAEEAFCERKQLNRFLFFYCALTALTAVYFIYIYYTSGVNVEYLSPPFPVLEYFGLFGPKSFQPNNLVDFFVPGFFFSLSFILYNHKRKLRHADPRRSFSEMLLFLCFTCTIMAAVFFTNSRAGILSFAAGLLYYFAMLIFFSGPRKRGIKFILWVVVAAVVFLGSLGVQKVAGELGTVHATVEQELLAKGTRAQTIGASWQLATQRGLLGVGLGNFHMGWLLTHKEPFTTMPERSYNDMLWLWAEAGFPALVFFAAAFLSFLVCSFKTARHTESSFIAYFSNAASASIIVFLAHSMVDPTFYVEALCWIAFVSLGVGGACIHMEALEVQGGFIRRMLPRKNPVIIPLVLIVLAGGISFLSGRSLLAFEYQRQSKDVLTLERAARMDVFNPYYPKALSNYYYDTYIREGDAAMLTRAFENLDEAVAKDPFALIFYKKRAEIARDSKNVREVEETFRNMHEKLPDFYLASLMEAAFYMDSSLLEKDASAASKYKIHALRAYQKALGENPRFVKDRDLFRHMTEESRNEFLKLLADTSGAS